ncbi:hypothetical protein PWT90_10543 [Aphanocladium album]|nr:hypothetical protein PWT90_10543 [Aphanocladium album]
MRYLSLIRALVAFALVGPSHQKCSEDDHCSLNGICRHSKCECDAGWKGTDCGILDLRPALRDSGYNHTSEGISSWGASIVRDPADEALYHIFFSRFANHCPLKSWMPFSTIMHAQSKTGPAGPYESPVEVLGTFAHNPTVVWSPWDREYLMYHIGCPQPTPSVCGPVKFKCGIPDGQSGITAHSSPDLETWTNRGMVFNGTYDKTVWDMTATNPSAWPLHTRKHETPTMLLAYRGNNHNETNFSSGNIAVSSTGFKGPYTRIQKEPLMQYRFEDPFLWQDKRGHYHMLVHSQRDDGGGGSPGVKSVGRHAYARDYMGPWNYGYNVSLAYGAQVSFTDGTTINYGRRERPQLLFSTDGRMTPLFMANGVQEIGTNMSYTIVSPIGDAGTKLQDARHAFN